MTEPDPVAEHQKSWQHREAILGSAAVACFYCGASYAPGEITEWVDEDDAGVGQTALCARCGIDAVIPVRPGIDSGFLTKMHGHWFGERSR